MRAAAPALLLLSLLLLLMAPPLWALGYTGTQLAHEDFADLGAVALLVPAGPARDLVIVLDDDAEIPAALYGLANRGHLVAHVPLKHFLESAAARRNACLDAVTLLDVFSQHLQQKFRFAHYQRPFLVGLGAAAPFALATIAQAPGRLFQAGVGVNTQSQIELPAPPCAAAPLSVQRLGSRHFRIAATDAPTRWQPLDNLHALDAFLDELATSDAADSNAVDDLPLVELPLPNNAADKTLPDVFVILLSGDGGWANIDKDIGEQLNRAGLPVIGWNSLQYFWRKKTPAQASRDLTRAIAHYQQLWTRPRVVLIGFSLGADVLPFMISRLPRATRAAIADTVFLGLGRQVDFQFHVTDWLGAGNDDARPIAPELASLIAGSAGPRLLCIYGTEDEDTMCRDRPAGVDVVELPGDHHFDGDYQRATQLILDRLRRPRPAPVPQHQGFKRGQGWPPSV